MINNNHQFLIQNEKFDPNYSFPSIKNINPTEVISLYENFKKIFPLSKKKIKALKRKKKFK